MDAGTYITVTRGGDWGRGKAGRNERRPPGEADDASDGLKRRPDPPCPCLAGSLAMDHCGFSVGRLLTKVIRDSTPPPAASDCSALTAGRRMALGEGTEEKVGGGLEKKEHTEHRSV